MGENISMALGAEPKRWILVTPPYLAPVGASGHCSRKANPGYMSAMLGSCHSMPLQEYKFMNKP